MEMNEEKVAELVALNKRLRQEQSIGQASFQKNQEAIVHSFMHGKSVPELITSDNDAKLPSSEDPPYSVRTVVAQLVDEKQAAEETQGATDPAATTQRTEALCAAVWNGDLEESTKILSQCSVFDANRLNARGQSALYCASRQGFPEIVILLLNFEGISVDKQMAVHGGTALHAAAFAKNANICALLLASGANSGIKNASGLSARAEAKGETIDVFTHFETLEEPELIKKYPILTKLKKIKGQRKRTGKPVAPLNTEESRTKKDKQFKEGQDLGNKFMSGFTVARSNPLMQGELTFKKQNYFFVLGPGVLYYCANEVDDLPKGYFPLKQYPHISHQSEEAGFSLGETPNTISIHLTSYSKENSSTWVAAIKKAIARDNGSNNQFAFTTESRLEFNVYVKIWDGKKLRNCKDTFVSCVASGQERERTPTQWHTTEPPYNHEFNIISLESAIQELSFTVYDLRKKGNWVVGEVSLPLQWGDADSKATQKSAVRKPRESSLMNTVESMQEKVVSTPGVSDWWELKPQKLNLDVLSKLELMIADCGSGQVGITVLKASGIGTSKEEKWVVGYTRTKIKGRVDFQASYRTDATKDAAWKNSPQWKFDGSDIIKLELFENHDGQHDVIGVVSFPPSIWMDKDTFVSKEKYSWNLVAFEAGALRLEYWPTKLYILSDTKYDDLFKLLLEDNFKLVRMLWKASDPKVVTGLAMALMRACEKKRVAVGLLKALLQEEIGHIKTFDTSFRGNTLATKTFEYYMKLICLTHLHQVLKPTMAQILKDHQKGKVSCELDPVRIEIKGKPTTDPKTQQAACKKNAVTLTNYCNSVFESVLGLVEILPMSMRVILTEIKKWFLERFENNMQAVYAGLTAFVFLRLIAPAISQPTVFGLTTNHPSKDAARSLMLCAITLQKLSNMKEFGEPHMMVMNDWIKKSIPKMKNFLETLSSIPTKPIDAIPVDHVAIDYGREMAVVADYVQASMGTIAAEFPDDIVTTQLASVMADLNIGHMALAKSAVK